MDVQRYDSNYLDLGIGIGASPVLFDNTCLRPRVFDATSYLPLIADAKSNFHLTICRITVSAEHWGSVSSILSYSPSTRPMYKGRSHIRLIR